MELKSNKNRCEQSTNIFHFCAIRLLQKRQIELHLFHEIFCQIGLHAHSYGLLVNSREHITVSCKHEGY